MPWFCWRCLLLSSLDLGTQLVMSCLSPQSVRMDVRLEHVCRNATAAGSALKGVKLLPVVRMAVANQTDAATSTLHYCVTVGYNQRLTVWELCRPNKTEETAFDLLTSSIDVVSGCDGSAVLNTASETVSFRLADFQDTWKIRWRAGDIVNVGDVSALDVAISRDKASATCVVAGEGFQLLNIHFN